MQEPILPSEKVIQRFFRFPEHDSEIATLPRYHEWDLMLYFLVPSREQTKMVESDPDDAETDGGFIYIPKTKLGYREKEAPYVAFRWDEQQSLWELDLAIGKTRWRYNGITEAEFRIQVQHHVECDHATLNEIIGNIREDDICGCGETALMQLSNCENCGCSICASCNGLSYCDGCLQLLSEGRIPEHEEPEMSAS